MGQYHIVINLDKKEFIHPHEIGNGLKLHEQCGWRYSTATVLTMLLAASNGRGGGDFSEHPLVGSWAGNRIAFIGDYAEVTDIPGEDAPSIYNQCSYNHKVSSKESQKWKNISSRVREMMSREFNIHYEGNSGWLQIEENDEDPLQETKTYVEKH
jgi:hypothetical protein